MLASLPCEDVSHSTDRRLNIHRVLFDIYASAFPALLGRLMILNIWRGGTTKITDTTRVLAPDGAMITEAQATFQAREHSQHVQVFLFADVVLPEEGEYTVEVRRDAVMALSYTIEVLEDKGGA